MFCAVEYGRGFLRPLLSRRLFRIFNANIPIHRLFVFLPPPKHPTVYRRGKVGPVSLNPSNLVPLHELLRLRRMKGAHFIRRISPNHVQYRLVAAGVAG